MRHAESRVATAHQLFCAAWSWQPVCSAGGSACSTYQPFQAASSQQWVSPAACSTLQLPAVCIPSADGAAGIMGAARKLQSEIDRCVVSGYVWVMPFACSGPQLGQPSLLSVMWLLLLGVGLPQGANKQQPLVPGVRAWCLYPAIASPVATRRGARPLAHSGCHCHAAQSSKQQHAGVLLTTEGNCCCVVLRVHHRSLTCLLCLRRCLKKVQEGIDEFDQIWQKVRRQQSPALCLQLAVAVSLHAALTAALHTTSSLLLHTVCCWRSTAQQPSSEQLGTAAAQVPAPPAQPQPHGQPTSV